MLMTGPNKFDFESHFDALAEADSLARRRQRGFHRQIARLMSHHIQSDQRVLEAGCGVGGLLNRIPLRQGVGIDISEKMVHRARVENAGKRLRYEVADVMSYFEDEPFDAIVLDFLTGYLPDIQAAFDHLHTLSHERTRLYITSLNTLWLPILKLAQPLGWVMKQPPSNWLSTQDLINLLEVTGWEVVFESTEVLCPTTLPVVDPVMNRYLVRCPMINQFGASIFIVARPGRRNEIRESLSCSVVVPARNESGNIQAALDRIPVLGQRTEVIFVEGNSTDDTWDTIQACCTAYTGPHRLKYMKQPGKGKWDAVFAGFEEADGNLLVIQDADLTAPPEDLPKFYEAIANGTAEFANGCRLVYPMESKAMRFLNLLGNKFFAVALSFVLKQPVKDSLCGTKMILHSDYRRLLKRIEVLGDFDPFGDFNLLFGSSLLDLKIRDIPVRYRDRTYGDTNISRFKHGWILLKMTLFGLFKLRFHK